MSTFSLPYVVLVDGANCISQNLSSATWQIYTPIDKFVSVHGICLGHTANNIMEYSALIELLCESIVLGIHLVVVKLDFELTVLQLSNVYSNRSPSILRVFLRVHFLEKT